VTIGREMDGTANDGNMEGPNVTSRVTDHLFVAPCDNKGVDACNHHKCVAPRDNIVASYDDTGTVTDTLELVAPRDNLGSTYSRRVLFWPFFQGGLLPCATTLSLRVTMRSNKDEVPLPWTGRWQRPNRTRARCLFKGKVQRRTFIRPARNVFVLLLRRRRRTYEVATAPRCGASPTSPPI
jgi:hypothetical protein